MVEEARQAIFDDRFEDYYKEFVKNYNSKMHV
jgi:queuine/archaeosine tRNA-ribosyltransferase